MIKHFTLIAIILLSALSLQAQAKKDEAAIRKVMDDQAAAWNRSDLEAFMYGYWKSDKLAFVSGDSVTRGWQQTLDNYKRTYGTSEKMGKLTFRDLEITVISRDSAFVLGSWSLARANDNPKGKFTLLWRKFRDGWRIVTDHSS